MVDRSFCPRCQRIVYSEITDERCPVCYSVLEITDDGIEVEPIPTSNGDEEVA